MGSTSPKVSEPSVVSLRSLTLDDMTDLLEQQRAEWRRMLDWDLGGVTEFLTHAIGSRSLKGSAVVVDSRPVGFGFYTNEVDRCLIGDLYVRPEFRNPEVNAVLTRGLLKQITASRARKRIESQSVSFDTRGFQDVFRAEGFNDYARSYLVRPLETGTTAADDHPRVELRQWRDWDFSQGVEVVYQSYRGSIDARANTQYRTREGCADLLDALTDSYWCGKFDADATTVAVDRKSNRICGVAITSRISDRAAHLGQISVLPIFQGEGIGSAMIRRSTSVAGEAGLEIATLAVTDENEAAARLYERIGFAPRLSFAVYAREAAPLGPGPRRPSGLR